MKKQLSPFSFLSATLVLLTACSSARHATSTATPMPTPIPTATSTPAVGPVILEFIGHDCFLLMTGDGTRIIMDPYNSYAAPSEIAEFSENLTANLVTISHFHSDHSNSTGVGGKPKAMFEPGSATVGPVKITGYKSDHGYVNGAPAGDNTVFMFEVGGMKIVHMGAAGVITQSDILAAIENADAVMIDAMGIDSHPVPEMMAQLRKSHVRTIIPTHNSISEANPFYGSLTVEELLELIPADERVNRPGVSHITVTPNMPVQVLVLTPLALSTQ